MPLGASVVKEKAEPKIAGRFRLIWKHPGNGIRLCHGGDSVALCSHSPVNDDEPIFNAHTERDIDQAVATVSQVLREDF
jgi:hypothetical protein